MFEKTDFLVGGGTPEDLVAVRETAEPGDDVAMGHCKFDVVLEQAAKIGFDLLGKGGMGSVYQALDLQTDTVVAVKIHHIGDLADPTSEERFGREVEVLTWSRTGPGAADAN